MSKKCAAPACKIEAKSQTLALSTATPPPPKVSHEQWAPIKSRHSWEKLDQHLPRENFSWRILPDAVCDDVLDKILFPDEVTGDLCSREEFDVAADLMFLKYSRRELNAEK